MSGQYDIVTVGGGLGGSALAIAMARYGARVLVLERTEQFKDRVRGETLVWGVEDAEKLGVREILRKTCGHETPWWDSTLGPATLGPRDLVATTPGALPYLTFFHPAMQESLVEAAEENGVEVRRNVCVCDVRPGSSPSVVFEENGATREIQARLIVGADGRVSSVRRWGRFTVRDDPPALLLAGVLLQGLALPRDDTQYWWMNPAVGQEVVLVPLGDGRVRAYLGYHRDVTDERFHGAVSLKSFIQRSLATGPDPQIYSHATAVGPLATFEGADRWVDHPYQEGVALVGDAAAASDPSFGQGLSLTLRDVRALRDALTATDNWDAAGHAYAERHDAHYGVIHAVNRWFTELMYARGDKADARRARALPLIAEDMSRVPDHIFSGPDLPADETVRRRFFGEA